MINFESNFCILVLLAMEGLWCIVRPKTKEVNHILCKVYGVVQLVAAAYVAAQYKRLLWP